MDRIIVTGGNHHNTYGVIRALGLKKVKPFLLLVHDNKESFLLKSKYISGHEIVSSEEDAISYLKKNKQRYKGFVIIACSDGMSSALDCNKNTLSDCYMFPSALEQGKITSIMDKETMSRIGKEVGFNVPLSWVVTSINDITSIEYPCITKPILSKDGHKSDISICQNRKELENVIQNGSCHAYQVQKFIKKSYEYQLIGLSLKGGDEVIIPGFSKCIRPCPGTNTGFLHYESLDDIVVSLEKCKKFVQSTGYSGLFSIEFLRDTQGRDYFMEMNFRNDGNAICVTASGTNLPYIWYLANTNGDYKEELEISTFKSVYAMPEFPDFDNFVRTKKMSLVSWLKDVIKADVFMVFNRSDIRPFVYVFSERLRNIKNRLLKRK